MTLPVQQETHYERRSVMATADDQFDDLINNCKKPGDLVGENSLLSQLFRTTLQPTIQRVTTELPDSRPEEE